MTAAKEPATLAAEHDARTLAAALIQRLRTDGRDDAAAVLTSVLSGEAVGILDPTPPNPHEEVEPST